MSVRMVVEKDGESDDRGRKPRTLMVGPDVVGTVRPIPSGGWMVRAEGMAWSGANGVNYPGACDSLTEAQFIILKARRLRFYALSDNWPKCPKCEKKLLVSPFQQRFRIAGPHWRCIPCKSTWKDSEIKEINE